MFKAESNSLNWQLFSQWVLATTLAWLITTVILIYRIVSPIWVLPIIGFAQWYVLEYYLPRVRWWIWTNILGVVISGAIIIALIVGGLDQSIPAHPLFSGTLTGTLVGLLQWVFLRQRVFRASWWIFVNTIGLVLGKVIDLAVSTLLGFFVGAVFGGMVFGSITGLLLIWLLQFPHIERS